MKKIVLCPNPHRDIGLKVTQKIYKLLEHADCRVVISPLFKPDEMPSQWMREIGTVSLSKGLADANMVVALGGDGTILRIAREASIADVPILGINLGTKGFMAEVERDEENLILSAVSGEFTIERRMMLDVAIERNGKVIHSDFALNEMVVGSAARIIDLTVYGDGRKITSFSGDGVIAATPTGSTAYSLSAGGPVVEPTAENIIITPICAHVLLVKAFVLDPGRKVMIKLAPLDHKIAYMSVDGCTAVNLESGDVVHVSKSEYETKLVKVSGRSFYEKVSEKLGDFL